MEGLVDPMIQITNSTSNPQNVSWRVTAVDINGGSLIPVANDTGSALLQPGERVIQRFDWIKLLNGEVAFNVVEFTSVDQITSEEQFSSIAQTVYPQDIYTLQSTGLYADVTPEEIILSTKISPPTGSNISTAAFVVSIIAIIISAITIIDIIFRFMSNKGSRNTKKKTPLPLTKMREPLMVSSDISSLPRPK